MEKQTQNRMFESKAKSSCYDTDKEINHDSWTNGGTLVTNLGFDRLVAYRKSVQWYNNKVGDVVLKLSPFAYDVFGCEINLCSLHIVKQKEVSLSDFWAYFDKVKELV